MLRRSIVVAVGCLSIGVARAPLGIADPLPDPAVGPADANAASVDPHRCAGRQRHLARAADSAPVASGNPGTLTTPEGLTLTVSATKESL